MSQLFLCFEFGMRNERIDVRNRAGTELQRCIATYIRRLLRAERNYRVFLRRRRGRNQAAD